MPHDLCCKGQSRTLSPDPPNARCPMLPLHSGQLLPRPGQSESKEFLSLTPSDAEELRSIVPMQQKTAQGGFPSVAIPKSEIRAFQLVSMVQKPFSKDILFIAPLQRKPRRYRPGKALKNPSVKLRGVNCNGSLHLLGNRTPSQGGYDADALLISDEKAAEDMADMESTLAPMTTNPFNANAAWKPGPHVLPITKTQGWDLCGLRHFFGISFVLFEITQTPLTSHILFSNREKACVSVKEGSEHWPIFHPHTKYTLRINRPVKRYAKALFDKDNQGLQPGTGVYDHQTSSCPEECSSINKITSSNAAHPLAAEEERIVSGAHPSRSSLEIERSQDIAQYDTTGDFDASTQSRRSAGAMRSTGSFNEQQGNESEVASRQHNALGSTSSIHLQNMKISQYLRSISSLSGTTSAVNLHKTRPCRIEPKSPSVQALPSKKFDSRKCSRSPSSKATRRVRWHPATKPSKHTNDNWGANEGSLISILDASGCNQVSESPRKRVIGRHNTQVSLDGPYDAQIAPTESVTALEFAPVESLGANYDEATSLWEKAFRQHHEEHMTPDRGRGFSFSGISRRSSRISRRSSNVSSARYLDAPENSASKPTSRSPTLSLRRVNTSHSFDLLAVPGRQSVSQTQLNLLQTSDLSVSPDRFQSKGRQRSHSQPPPIETKKAEDPPPSAWLLVPGIKSRELRTPDITVTNSPSTSLNTLATCFRLREPESSIWCRFPSHTREERNGPAGIDDNIRSRDFALETEPFHRNDEAETKQAKKHRKGRLKIRGAMFRRRFMSRLSQAWKPQSSGFHKRQQGHRSSIAIGGILEYPELELLPRSELHRSVRSVKPLFSGGSSTQVTRRASSRSVSYELAASKSRSLSIGGGRNESTCDIEAGSSNYSSAHREESFRSPHGSFAGSATVWSDYYGQYVCRSPTRTSETGTLLDESHLGDSETRDPDAACVRKNRDTLLVPNCNSNAGRVSAVREGRRSTLELHSLLDELDSNKVTKAIEVADAAFEK